MAESLGQTVQQLLTGKALPLSHAEYVQWIAYYKVKASKEKQRSKSGGPSRSGGRGRKR